MQTKRYLSVTDTAKLVRVALKGAFPGVKFSVRSDSYAGGASIDVRWTDGPTQREVQQLCDLWRGATFDGMTDMKSYHSTLLTTDNGFEEVSLGADFIFAKREHSPEFRAALLAEIAKAAGRDEIGMYDDADVYVNSEGRAVPCSGLQHFQRHVQEIYWKLAESRAL